MAKKPLRVILGLLVMGTLLTLGLVLTLSFGGAAWVVNQVLRRVSPFPSATLRSGAVTGNLLTGVRLHDVRLTRSTGQVAVRLDSLDVGYDPRQLLGDEIVIREVRVFGPRLDLRQQPDSSWDFPRTRAWRPGASPSRGPHIEIGRVSVVGGSAQVRFIRPRSGRVVRVDDIRAEGARITVADGLRIGMAEVRGRIRPEGIDPEWATVEAKGSLAPGQVSLASLTVRSPTSAISASGTVPLPPGKGRSPDLGRLDVHAAARPLRYRDLGLLSAGFDRAGSVGLTLDARGEEHGASLRLSAETSDGGSALIEGFLTGPGVFPVRYRGSATVRKLDPSLLTLGRSRSARVNGDLEIDLRGPRADSMDGSGRFRIYDSRLGSFHARRAALRATFSRGRARVELEGESGPLAVRIGGWLRPFDAVPSYDLIARLGRARQDSAPGWLDRLLGSGGTAVSLHVRGRSFDPRRAGLRAFATLVPGGGPRGLLDSAAVEARLADGRAGVRGRVGVAGGMVAFDGGATLGDELRYRIRHGSIDGLDLAGLLGETAASTVGGTFSLRGRGTSPASMALQGAVSAARATYGPHLLTDGRVEVGLDRGTARIAARATVDGAGVELSVTGRPFSAEPALAVERLRFRHLDLARIAPAAGIASDLSGTGRLRARGRRLDALRLDGGLVLDRSRLGAEWLDRGTIDASLSRGELGLHAQLVSLAGRVTLRGTARPFDAVPTYDLREGTFQDLDLGHLLARHGLRTRLAGSLRAEGSGRRPERAKLSGTLSVGPSMVNRLAIRTGRLELGLADGRLRLTGRLIGEGDSVAIDAFSEPFASPARLRIASDIAVSDLASLLGRDTIDAGAAARVAVEGEWGRPETMRLRGSIHGGGHFAGLSLDSLDADLRLADGMLEVDTLSVRSNVGEADGAGRLALFARDPAARSAARLEARISDLAPLGPLLGLGDLAVDSGLVTVSIAGPRDRPHLSADVYAADLAQGPRRARAVRASLEGDLGADRSLLAGRGDLLVESVSIPGSRIAGLQVRGSYAGQELAVRGEADLDRRRRGVVAARVYPAVAERRLELDTLDVRGETETWTLGHPVRVTYGQRLQVNDFALTSGTRRIAVDGVVDRGGEQRLGVRIDSLPIDWLGALLGVRALGGELNGALDLSGPAAAPRLGGDLALGLRSGKKKVGAARARIDWLGARGLRLDLGVYHPEGDTIRVTGQIPLALSLTPGDSGAGLVSRIPSGTLALDAAADDFRIDMVQPLLDPATVKTLRGRLTVDAHARGSLEAPALSGTLDLSDAKVQLPSLGATYDEGRIRTTLQGEAIRLTEAQFQSGHGRLDAAGLIRLGRSAAVLDLDATLQEFRLADAENFRATVSGKLHVGGTPAAPALGGAVSVRNLDYYLQATGHGQAAEPVELTPADLRVLENRFGVTADRPRRGAPSRWALDLGVELAGNDWLRRRTSPAIAVELSGKLQVRKDAGEDLRVFGTIQPLAGRSFVETLGRRFEVTSGEVGLNGPLKDARLELNAEYRADSGSSATPSGVVITTRLTVDTGQLALTLGSRPKMSNADISSYLATGRPAGTDPTRTTEEVSPLTAGASLVVGAALGSVAGGAGRALGLDVVQVLQDRNGEQTLVAGKYVSPPLYLGFREPIVARTDPTQAEGARTTMEWEVEYAALRRALLNLQGSGNEFRIFLRLRQ